MTPREPDHATPTGVASIPPPLAEPVRSAARPTPAEEARTLVASTSTAMLATLSEDGSPWGSLVVFAPLDDGSPVLVLSSLAEHGRNLGRDGRASIVVASPQAHDDPLGSPRVTLAGRVERPGGERADAARDAYLATHPGAESLFGFGDFSLWVLEVERLRWVGGYGVMGSGGGDAYRAAAPDPVAATAPGAVAHLNEDHADALVAIARALAGYGDATAARCTALDRYALDLLVETPRGAAPARVAYAAPLNAARELRLATVALAREARVADRSAGA